MKSDLNEAFEQVALIKHNNQSKQTLKEFLNELSVIPSEKFKRESKRLIKKYPSLKEELIIPHQKHLKQEHHWITKSIKSEFSIKSKGKGKSGGGRVIIYLVTEHKEVYLLTIYYKSEFDLIDDNAIKSIITSIVKINVFLPPYHISFYFTNNKHTSTN